MVLEDLDELPARPEEENGAELGIDAAAEDELVAVAGRHPLHGDALEMLLSGPLGHGLLDGAPGPAHGLRARDA